MILILLIEELLHVEADILETIERVIDFLKD